MHKYAEMIMHPACRTHGGARVPHHKNTLSSETVIMPPPAKVVLPMQQHIGAPCVPAVKAGDTVRVGQLIADSDEWISAPIHASVSGTVTGMTEVLLPNGAVSTAVEIESDGKMSPDPSLCAHPVSCREDLVRAAHDCGLVGLGGAGFPTHVKLSPNKNTRLDTLIVNAAECEPYITSDYRECMENASVIMDSIYMLLDYLAVDRVLIAVEDDKPKAIEVLARIAADKKDEENRVRVVRLRSHYPQGAEKILVQAVTGRKIPMGRLPADVGCAVMNITSISILQNYVATGMPLVRKRITVDGPAVRRPQNIWVPIGTPVNEVFDFAGGFKSEPSKILMGGPMMGLALADDRIPVMKQTNALLAFDRENDPTDRRETACIRCGRCASACPMSLMPTLIERYARAGDVQRLQKIGVSVCMECGSCAYSCPAHRPLVQYMRTAKVLVKKEETGK